MEQKIKMNKPRRTKSAKEREGEKVQIRLVYWNKHDRQAIQEISAVKKNTLIKKLEKIEKENGIYRVDRVSPQIVDIPIPEAKSKDLYLELDFKKLYKWANKQKK